MGQAGRASRSEGVREDGRLAQGEAGGRIGLPQPKLANMLRGKVHGISEDKMMRCLAALGHDVTITVNPARKKQGWRWKNFAGSRRI